MQVRQGACFNSGYNDGSLSHPFCFTSQDRPVIGCRDPEFDLPTCKPFEVIEQGIWYWRTWLTPATTQAECLSLSIGRYGCYLPLYSDYHLTFFNVSDCDCSEGVMRNAWEWTQGVWIGGQVRKMEKVVTHVTPKYVWNASALSFKSLQTWLSNSVEIQFLYALKSEALCSWNVVETNLNAVTCDCVASDALKGTL
jgi:hypothetical protein